MRILHIITNSDIGGAQKVAIDLCAYAVSEGYGVAAASMANGPFWSQLDPAVKQYRLKYMIKPINLPRDFLSFFEIKRVINNFNPDVIHLHSSKAGVLGRLAAGGKRERIVYTIHGFDTIRLNNRKFLPLERILQRFCGAIVPVSDYDCRNLKAEGVARRITVIKNAVARPQKIAEELLPQCVQEARENGTKIIMTIARIARPKRPDAFIETARALLSQPYLFIWIGAPTDDSLSEYFKTAETPENTVFTGDIINAASLLPYADLFALFSDYEGLPITILEALSCGLPIVASNSGGIPELVDKNNGFLVENAQDAAERIQSILSDEKLKASLGAASLRKYQECFTPEKMWNKYKRLYESLVK